MKQDAHVLRRLDELSQKARAVEGTKRDYGGFGSAVDAEKYEEWATSCLSLLQRVFGGDSPHYRNFTKVYYSGPRKLDTKSGDLKQ